MAQLESFSTAGMEDPRRRLTFWNDIACDSFTPIVSDPVDISSFAGSIVRGRIGDLTVAEAYSEAQLVRHSRLHVARTRAPMFFLHLQVDGQSLNRQDGREAVLTAGDFTLCDSTRPYEIQFNGPNHMFVLGIPDASLRRHLASPECLVAIRMPGDPYRFIAAMRRRDAKRRLHTPTLAIVGSALDRRRAASAGIHLHVARPLDRKCRIVVARAPGRIGVIRL